MLKIKLIVLGKLKEAYLSDAAKEYIKRLGRYCRLEVFELSDLSLPDNPSQSEIEKVLSKEADGIVSKLGNTKNVCALCIEGKEYTSEGIAELLTRAEENGGEIAFIIGSSHGLCSSVKEKAGIKLSMSRLTFPHQLARIMLLEQLYRGFKIKNNENYHK